MELKASLPVTLFKQGRRYVAYCPILDISTSGKSEAEAKKRFTELVPIFFEELGEAGTMHDVLTELGWTRGESGSTTVGGWKQPEVKSERMQVRIPVMV